MDRRKRTRQELRRERRETLGYFAAIVGLVILGKCFWDALLTALEAAML